MSYKILIVIATTFLASFGFAIQRINDQTIRVDKVWNCKFQGSNGSYIPSSTGKFSFTRNITEDFRASAEANFITYQETSWADMVHTYRLSDDGNALIGYSLKYAIFAITLIDNQGSLIQYWVSDNEKLAADFKGTVPENVENLVVNNLIFYDKTDPYAAVAKKVIAALLVHSYNKTDTLAGLPIEDYMTCPLSEVQSKIELYEK